jgi:hypothetical protein
MPVENNGGQQQNPLTPNAANKAPDASLLDGVKEPELETEYPEWYAYSLHQEKQPWLYRISSRIKKKAIHTGLHDWLMVIFTFVLTGVGIGQGILAYQNFKSSPAQIQRFLDAAARIEDAGDSFAKSSADINRGLGNAVSKLGEQATTATDALNASRSQFAEAERPWIAIDPNIRLSTSPFPGPFIPTPANIPQRAMDYIVPNHWQIFSFSFANIGHSPAKNIVAEDFVNLIVSPATEAIPDSPQLEKCNLRTSGDADSVAMPNQAFNRGFPHVVFQEPEIHEWLVGKRFLEAYGCVKYLDGRNVFHQTNFCYFMAAQELPIKWGLCRTGNNAW